MRLQGSDMEQGLDPAGWGPEKGLKQKNDRMRFVAGGGGGGGYRLVVLGSRGSLDQGRPAYLRLEKDHSQAMGAARDPWPCLQEAWERSLAEMESSHQQVMEELQRHHERELQRLQQEKEWLLAEETAATASGEDPGKEWHSGLGLANL